MCAHQAAPCCTRHTRAGRARALLDRQVGAELHDFLVRAAKSQMQEAERIEERLRRVPESFDHDLLRDLGGLRAVGVAAHAIDHDEQGRVVGDRDSDPILVVLARRPAG